MRIVVMLVIMFWKYASACEHYHDSHCLDVKPIDGRHFLNQWIVEIDGDEEIAKRVAEETGFVYMEPIKGYAGHYFFTHQEIPRRHKMKHEASLEILRVHKKIKCVDQQYVWKPTIRQLVDYKEFIGYEKAKEVKVTDFDAQERSVFYDNLRSAKNTPSYEDERIRSPLDQWKALISRFMPKKREEVPKLPPLKEALYEEKKKLKAERQKSMKSQ